jgi:hypothetical protein
MKKSSFDIAKAIKDRTLILLDAARVFSTFFVNGMAKCVVSACRREFECGDQHRKTRQRIA